MTTAASTQQPAIAGEERPIMQSVRWVRTDEGAEFMVERVFPQGKIQYVDPILLLDVANGLEAGRPDNAGYLPHPHAGFFTVTYIIDGPPWDGYDSTGDNYTQETGSVSWFVAGKGAVHVERPASPWREEGGDGVGAQLWIDLPNELKDTTEPDRAYVAPDEVPEWESEDGSAKVRVLVGELFGMKSPAHLSPTALSYYHVILQPGASVSIPTESGHNAIARPIGDEPLTIGETELPEEHFVVLGPAEKVTFSASADAKGPTHALLVAAEPHDQQIAYLGPFSAVNMQKIGEHFANGARGVYGKLGDEAY